MALGCISFAVGLGVSEVGLRLVAAGDSRLGVELRNRDPGAVQIVPMGIFGFRQKPGGRFHYPNGTTATANELGYRGPPVAVPKPPGVFRIALFGGSTTHGWGVADSATLDEAMRRQLQAYRPDLRIEVVNLAFDGYDSYQLFERLRSDGLRFEPDIAIVHEGINDVRNARFARLRDRDPRTLLWAAEVRRLREERSRGPSIWTRLRHWLVLARLPSYARALVSGDRGADVEPATAPTMEAADYFERNLIRIANLAGVYGITVLFSTPPSSLRLRYAPRGKVRRTYFVVDNATTQSYRDSLSARMRAVAERLERSGRDVGYVAHGPVPPDEFLDDAHLTPAGNARVAAEFVAALLPRLPARVEVGGTGRVR